MNNNNLVHYLTQEITWVEQLNKFLEEEREILGASQFAQLEELAQQKQELSNKLEESAQLRMGLIKNTAGNNANLSLKEHLQQYSPAEAKQINILNDKLAEQLVICRNLNTVNGQVIANNMHMRQEIVNVLSGKKDGVSVYNAAGSVKSTADKKHHQKA